MKIKVTIGIIILVIIGVVIGLQNLVTVEKEYMDGEALLKVKFLLPMEQVNIQNYMLVEDGPKEGVKIAWNWEDDKHVNIILKEQGDIKGHHVKVSLRDLPTKSGIRAMNESIDVHFVVRPNIRRIEPETHISTKGDIHLYFNTFMRDNSVVKNLQVPFKHVLTCGVDEEGNLDRSHWIITPKVPLAHNTEYRITLIKYMESIMSKKLDEDITLVLKTGNKPYISEILVNGGSGQVGLYPEITIVSNEPIGNVVLDNEELNGRITYDKKQASIIPKNILKPATTYTSTVYVENKAGEKSEEKRIKFTTVKINEEKIWVEVYLGSRQEVYVYQGSQLVKKMRCSGGKPDSPTLLGTFYLKDRGLGFYSKRFEQGAKYWVRFKDQYLFHGVPQDVQGNTIQEELDKIGSPASHGCIRMLDEDAKWFYENVPYGTMVIIHE